ncbi:RNase H domain-containing protein [Abeliophyllum distichum]|uniref:RNase H domain-containing protein n=1 Tax=Abeliophyllum distichum TaxID=126358 RepID=A0ABD1Q1B6_9LAMI
MGLMQVIQDKGETLREYMSSFNRATLGIKNLQMPLVVTALLSGLRNHAFRASLSKKPPESMTELLRRGEEYIDQEEVLKSTRADRKSYESGSKKRRREEKKSMSDKCNRWRVCRRRRFKKFEENDLNGVSLPHDDALVITGDIADFDVKRVLVDTGSTANVLSWDAFTALKMPADRLKSVNTPLQRFGGGIVIPEGVIDLPVVLGKYPCCISLITPFLIVRAPMAYNSIYGRPIINAVEVVKSTQHQSMKFPTSRGVGVVKGDQLTSRRCYVDSIRTEVNLISEVKPIVLEIKKKDHEQAHRFKSADELRWSGWRRTSVLNSVGR